MSPQKFLLFSRALRYVAFVTGPNVVLSCPGNTAATESTKPDRLFFDCPVNSATLHIDREGPQLPANSDPVNLKCWHDEPFVFSTFKPKTLPCHAMPCLLSRSKKKL